MRNIQNDDDMRSHHCSTKNHEYENEDMNFDFDSKQKVKKKKFRK